MNRREFLEGVSAAAVAAGSATAAAATASTEYDPVEKSIAELSDAQAHAAVSAEALTQAYLRRIERYDRQGPKIGAVLAVNPDALSAARALDAERRAGKLRGPLHGIPLLIKDNIETRDPLPTTAGSLALASARHTQDAPVVARLRAAGAIVIGKANLSEWANFRALLSVSGWSAVGGQTRCPYDPTRNPSGSSAGPAAGTAANFCAAAIGSETDGSILAPASLNAVVGLKPTVGLVERRRGGAHRGAPGHDRTDDTHRGRCSRIAGGDGGTRRSLGWHRLARRAAEGTATGCAAATGLDTPGGA